MRLQFEIHVGRVHNWNEVKLLGPDQRSQTERLKQHVYQLRPQKTAPPAATVTVCVPDGADGPKQQEESVFGVVQQCCNEPDKFLRLLHGPSGIADIKRVASVVSQQPPSSTLFNALPSGTGNAFACFDQMGLKAVIRPLCVLATSGASDAPQTSNAARAASNA